ncbi:chalcone-flavanone isomerase-domain-containing protein [Cladorrhinum samala]|uniref:Chalcone-flavanone isomerase-domain-containing protein n=1 Tax=Cladorrhinum samala TaxID=585594 RepID=A0AAV9HJK7_9PEZI|nr:chalcone-flavanone isomerase-domain-containing protein [Cladorrhinum samala]
MLRQPVLRHIARSPVVTPNVIRPHVPCRAFRTRGAAGNGTKSLDSLNIQRINEESSEYHRNRRTFLWCGAIAGVVSFTFTAYKLVQELKKQPTKLDSSLPTSDPLSGADAADRKVVVHDEDGREIVPTGNSTVPTFPRTIDLPSYTSPLSPEPVSTAVTTTAQTTTEYTLVGLGLRTVTFIGIQVYVVGFYVATSDIAALQSALVKKVNPIATTLVPGERDQLRTELLDPEQSGKVWDELLAQGIPARSAFRVIPVRDTDFHHLRDGFVRAIQDRTKQHANDDNFGEAMRQFRAIFNRGSVPKRKELLLVRDETGKLSIAYDGSKSKKTDRQLVGVVEDERVSRALWLNYLGGKAVASEPARKSIVEGIMEFVERPIGTVAAQVVPVVKI